MSLNNSNITSYHLLLNLAQSSFCPLVGRRQKEKKKGGKRRSKKKEGERQTEKKMERTKSNISYETCRDLMKEHLGEEPGDAWQCEDVLYIISKHLSFFKGVAEHSTRLNATALSLNAQYLWGMEKHKATLWGKSMSMCLSHIWRSGSRATSGEKLSPEVQAVYKVMSGGKIEEAQAAPATTQVKSEIQVKVKEERASAANLFTKRVASPRQIRRLYSLEIQDSPAKKPKVHWILYQGGLL